MRYQAMLMTDSGKRWMPLRLDKKRPFAIWDHNRSEWWKGAGTGIAYYSTIESADARVQTLEDNTFVSNIKASPQVQPEAHVLTFIRFWMGERLVSNWKELDRKIVVISKEDGTTGIDGDYAASRVSQFYLNEKDMGEWVDGVGEAGVPDGRGGWNIQVPRRHWVSDVQSFPRDDWNIEVHCMRNTDTGPETIDRRMLGLPDFVDEREGMLESVRHCADWQAAAASRWYYVHEEHDFLP